MKVLNRQALKIGLLLENIARLFGARKRINDRRFLELAGFIFAVRKLQTDFVEAESKLNQTKGLAAYHEAVDFLQKGSKPLIQRYSSAELMLRAVIAILEEGIHQDYEAYEPIDPESRSGNYVQSKLNNALSPFHFEVVPKKARQ
jgi:hypothetical protein